MRKFCGLLILLFSFSILHAQGIINGTVFDEQTGEPLIGVNVLVMNTKLGTTCDLDGKYSIKNIPAGTYSLRYSFVGYTSKVLNEVAVSDGKTITLDITLTSEAIQTNEVVIQAKAEYNSESAILTRQKDASSISDGISAEQIKRSTDATSADALKRVTGLFLLDNKFVFIRGITDRYNNTTLDGASVTSTEAGKRSFSFDLLPANLLENTSVIKSPTPDLPGDFTGGLVQLNTLDFPSNRVVKLSVSSSFNSNTTGEDFYTSQGGAKDWLGYDDGTRSFPENQNDAMNIALNSPNTWAPQLKNAQQNGSFSLAMGDHYDIETENSSSSELGYIAALSYKNSFQRNHRLINDFAVGRTNLGTKDNYSVLWGAIANISYKAPDGLHKLSLKNSFNQSGEDNITRFRSEDLGTTLENLYTIVNWSERTSYTGQLTGEHNFPRFGGLSLQWRGSVSSSRREDPDRKEITYYRDLYDQTLPFTAAINQRSWSYLNERTSSASTDFSFPVLTSKIKFGALAQLTETNYRIRYFNVTPDYMGGIPESLTTLPLEKIYVRENFGKGKFLFTESSKATDSYEGDQKLFAGYAMLDIPFEIISNKFRFVGGARMENSEQNVFVPRTLLPNSLTEETQLKNIDILPSLNLTYAMNGATNLRFAYSHSVNRPDFRELASTGFYDFIKYELVGGNPNLQRAFIKNYDVRLEVFPNIGELFAISYFSKNISNAIEEQLVQTATRTRTWFNSNSAQNFGWEIEVRKSLQFLGGYFQNFSLSGNYTRIESSVEVVEAKGNSQNTEFVHSTRPLQGQSPYMINFSLLFVEPTIGTSINFLYNKFGRRLDAVGFNASDIYEEPRDMVDLAFVQPIFQKLEGKFSVKNLTDKDIVWTRDEQVYEQRSIGRTYSLQLSYSF